METAYQRRLLMLQGQGGQTGFVNLERQRDRLTLKFQVVGLERNAGDVRGLLVSLRERKKVDCGRLRVDARGQGGLLKEMDLRQMQGVSPEAYDCIVITTGDQAILAGALYSKAVDWEALRGILHGQQARITQTDVKPSRTQAQPTAEMPAMPERAEAAAEKALVSEMPVQDGPAWLSKPADALDAQDYAALERAYERAHDRARPRSAFANLAMIWPREAEDLRTLFESGEPYEQLELPGWRFVRVPGAMADAENILGALSKDGRVVQTACLFQGEEAPEPPPGLDGYVYARDIGAGYWTQWRDYSAEDEIEQIS